MIIRDLIDSDLPALLAIHNDAVLNTTSIWDEAPVDLENRRRWLQGRRQAGFAALACEQDGELLGYASFGDFRAWSGYRHCVEHSVYVAPDRRRRGAARLLLGELTKRAQAIGKHAMVGGVEGGNAASLSLHISMGFTVCGSLPQVGAKFGRWLDLVFVHRLLGNDSLPPI
jgi:L-amino acid N-acyltransferase YncA